MRLGIDLGGTKIESAVIGADGGFRDRRRAPNPRTYDAMLDVVADLIAASEQHVGQAFERVGFSIPGSPAPRSGLIRNANSTFLNGRPLADDLERRLARRVRLTNDANALALSEAADGAAAGFPAVFGVIAGTGLGGGFVIDGRAIEGRNGLGGEWGHLPLPAASADEDTRCWCGRRNCLETYVSGSGLQRDFAEATGEAVAAEAIVARARSGEPVAAAALERLIERFGRGLSLIVSTLDPDMIVIGGGLSNVPEIVAGIEQALRPHVFSDAVDTPVRAAVHGDSSGVRGAAWLWPA